MLEFTKNSIQKNGKPYDGLPIGTILMYDGENWINNYIMPGWFACDGNNNTPDLTDKFITSGKTQQSGGNSIITLQEANLPAHKHTKGTLIASSSNNHRHHTGYNVGPYGTTNTGKSVACAYTTAAYPEGYTESAGAHEHNMTGSTDKTGGNSPLDITPEYYSLIFIKKMH